MSGDSLGGLYLDADYRPTKVSKFCTSLSALYPELPHNKWMRALRRPWAVADERVITLAS